MNPTVPSDRTSHELREANRRFYDGLWAGVRLVEPERFNTWPLLRPLVAQARRRLEVGAGLRPRLPLAGTHFVDISAPALERLRELGGNAVLAPVTSLPFPDEAFDLVCALDIVEHVGDDDCALSELARVVEPGGVVLVSAPLHPKLWTAFDEFVGHYCRYEPAALVAKLAAHGLAIERSAAYGMAPRSSRLLELGMWFLTHRRQRALWWYNRVFMPLAVRFEKALAVAPGMIDTENVSEILLVCRRAGAGSRLAKA
ncbi:MAG: class I SAM-dependent methyltransferase [Betaproteobacteria bacterium]|nr:class I SAM-dependent methyltransferase [Betaproteobacteria bacterium]